MIGNLDELVAYTQSLSSEIPELSESILIKRPGCSKELIETLRNELPGIPQSYLGVVSKLDIDGIAIGYFRLSPGTDSDLVGKIINCNREAVTPMARRFRDDGIYQVAALEADPIGVAFRPGDFAVGQVVKYNIGDPQKSATVLAEDFEQFLILAGNLDAVRQKFAEADDPRDGMGEFDACIGMFFSDSDSGARSAWRAIAEVVLS